jgi:hypothetical protein
MNPIGNKCSIKNCEHVASIYLCDICNRPICVPHHVLIDPNLLNKNQIPVILKDAIKQGVRGICIECLLVAELKEIEDTPEENLPLLINRNFITYEAYNYYCSRVSGEKKDEHIFDFFKDIIKNLVKKIKEEENKS